MTVVAVSMRTESGDDYLSLFMDIESPEDFVDGVYGNMGEELAYVSDVLICTDNGNQAAFEKALWDKINPLGSYDDE